MRFDASILALTAQTSTLASATLAAVANDANDGCHHKDWDHNDKNIKHYGARLSLFGGFSDSFCGCCVYNWLDRGG